MKGAVPKRLMQRFEGNHFSLARRRYRPEKNLRTIPSSAFIYRFTASQNPDCFARQRSAESLDDISITVGTTQGFLPYHGIALRAKGDGPQHRPTHSECQ